MQFWMLYRSISPLDCELAGVKTEILLFWWWWWRWRWLWILTIFLVMIFTLVWNRKNHMLVRVYLKALDSFWCSWCCCCYYYCLSFKIRKCSSNLRANTAAVLHPSPVWLVARCWNDYRTVFQGLDSACSLPPAHGIAGLASTSTGSSRQPAIWGVVCQKILAL